MTGVFVRWWPCEAAGRTLYDNEGRGWSSVAASQRMQKIAGKPPKTMEWQGNIPMSILEELWPC